RWGSPTATPPFEPLDFAPKDKINEIFYLISTASSASALTVPKPRSLSLSKGPSPNRKFIPSLTHPALKAVFSFRV
ncbi:MAG: hypothetical protein WCJ06_05515, partial [Planctomycetota bacterium]